MFDSWLGTVDRNLFLLVNGRWHTGLLDRLMPVITEQDNWVPVLIGLWVAVMIWGGRRGRIVGVLALVALALSDQLSSHLLKPLVGRIRPCNALPAWDLRLLVRGSDAFSFPSSHASNSFAMATVFSWGWPRLLPVLFGIAGMVAYSRAYVGVHYPLDALGGALLGLGCGRLSIVVGRFASARWRRRAA